MTPFFINIRKATDSCIKQGKKNIREYISDMKNPKNKEVVDDIHLIIYNQLDTLFHFILDKYYDVYRIDRRDYYSMEKFLYTADGHTLRQRIQRWIDEYNKYRDKSLLFYRLGLVCKHGLRYLDANLNYRIVLDEHFTENTFFFVTTDAGITEACESCRDWHGTYDLRKGKPPLPPYHPDCDCIYWYHKTVDPKDEKDDENWMPEQEGETV